MEQRYYRSTQIANIATTVVGFILSIPGLVALILHALSNGNGVHILTFIIFGSSLLTSYALFRILYHATIYLLIAGTYTPFTRFSCADAGGWTPCLPLRGESPCWG
ncbi:MAG: hypothetical protein OQK97_07220 [Deltaproteobacteria bacterium]|jgi:hemolysin III|nr:hypothetical protein [Deltaproteobacteria bacterium]